MPGVCIGGAHNKLLAGTSHRAQVRVAWCEVTSSPPVFRVSGRSLDPRVRGPAEHSPGSELRPRKCLRRDRPVAFRPLLSPSA